MANNIDIKDASNTTITIRTVDDGTGKQFNQSIPTDSAGNVATVVSNGQNVSTTHGALAVGLSPNSPLPAGTNHLGKVSIAGAFDVSVGSVVIADNAPVSVHGGILGSVSIGGGTATIGKIGVNTDKVVIGAVSIADGTLPTGPVTQSGTWTVQPGNTANTTPWLVSVGGNVSLTDNAPVSIRGGVLGSVSIGGGSAIIGKVSTVGEVSVHLLPNADKVVIGAVSIADGSLVVGTHAVTQSGTWTVQPGNTANTTPWLVSVGGNVSLTDNAPVSIRGGVLGAVSIGGGTATIGKLGVNTDKVVIGAVSLADGTLPTGPVTQSGTWTVQPGNTANTTPWLVSVGGNVSLTDNAPVSVRGGLIGLNAGTNAIGKLAANTDKVVIGAVSIADASINVGTVTGITQVVSIGGAVSLQAVQVAFRDGSSNARTPYADSGGIQRVSIMDGSIIVTGGAGGSSMVVSVGGNVSTQAYPFAGSDGTDARLIRTDTAGKQLLGATGDKVVIGAVSIADGAITVGTHAVTQSGKWLVSVTDPLPAGTNLIGKVCVADSALAVTQSGAWNINAALTSTNNNVALTSVAAAPVQTGTGTATNSLRVTLAGNNTDKVVVGAVSIADAALAATQSGTWTVQPGNTANTTPWLVSVGGNVSLSDNAPVSVRGGVLGAVSIGGGSALIGAVSIRQIVSVRPEGAIGSAIGVNAMPVGGTDGTNLVALLVDALGALKVTGFVTNSETSFTRPTDTVQYASGDLVANVTIAGNVTPMTFAVSRYAAGGGTIMVRRARIVKSTGSLTNAQFRLHLYNTSNGITNQGVSVAGGDNTVYNASKVSTYLGFLSVAMQVSHSDGAAGWGSPNEGMEMNFVLPTAQFTIQGLLEARGAYTPISAERFNVTLEAYQD